MNDDRSSLAGNPRLTIDGDAREAQVDGTPVDLTRLEFDMLSMLHRNPRIVISNEELSRTVLGSDWFTGAHSIAVHIGAIRHKLGPDCAGLIVTKRGVGYMFDPRVNGHLPDESGGLRPVELTYDRDLVLIDVNPADQPFFGWQPDEVIGTNFLLAGDTYFDEIEVPRVTHLHALLAAGTTKFSADTKLRCANGRLVEGHIEVQLLADADGKFAGMHGRALKH